MRDFWSKATELESGGIPFVVVTLIQVRGHAPQEPGAKMIVTSDGLFNGTVGGGKIEANCIVHAQSILKTFSKNAMQLPAPEVHHWNLQRDVGMTCGGEVTVLFETHFREVWNIVVFGAGHVAQSLSRALLPLECKLTVVDHRPEWLEKLPRSKKLTSVLNADLPSYVRSCDHRSFFVIMTQGHATDFPVLQAVYETFPDCNYVGIIGSKVKGIKIRAQLKELGASEEFIAKFRCPMGLPLGTNDPAEISISIISELIQVRDSLSRLDDTNQVK